MKRLNITLLFSLFTLLSLQAQEFKVITIVESIVPAGLGRSRIIEHQDTVSMEQFTTQRNQGTDSDQEEVKRDAIKIDNLSETKLLNFYSVGGINFRNIASNDAVITAKINQMIMDGWELVFVASGVESSGKGDNQGIFITRLYFRK